MFVRPTFGVAHVARRVGQLTFNGCEMAVDGGSAMKRLVACLVVALAWTWAGGAGEAFAKRASAAKAVQGYAVIRVGDEVRVVARSSVNQEKKNANNKYKADMKAYQEAKKATATSPDHGADLKKPTKAVVTVLKASVKTQAEAIRFRDKYLAEHEGLSARNTVAGKGRY